MKVEKRVWQLFIGLFILSIILFFTGNPIIILIGIGLFIVSGLILILCVLGTVLID